PAMRSERHDLSVCLKKSSLTQSSVRGKTGTILIIAEVALALVLTLSAGLLVNSYTRLIRVDIGFAAEKVLACVVLVPNSQYHNITAKMQFFDRVIERVKQIPGVESAAVSDALPYSGQQGSDQFRIEGRAPSATIDPAMQAEMSTVSSEFIQ